MKKILLLALAILTLPMPALPETDPQTVQILENLNRKYYCLSREGLKGFTCNAKCTLDQPAKEHFKSLGMPEPMITKFEAEGFTVSMSADGTVNAEPAFGFSANDEAARKNAEYFRSVVLNLLKAWAEADFKPLHDPKDFPGCIVEKGLLGFKVVKMENNVRTIEKYDWRSKLTGVSVGSEKNTVTQRRFYSKSGKGYLLDRTESVKAGQKHSVKYKYQTIGNFQLLESIESTGANPDEGKKIQVVIRFSNYRLTQ